MREIPLTAFFIIAFLSATAQPVAEGVKADAIVHSRLQRPAAPVATAIGHAVQGVAVEAVDPTTVDTITIRSETMGKDIRCVVIRPVTADSLPVLYLLHGWSGNYSNWISKVPELREWASTYHLMIVCPDGGFSSWYFDSPADPSSKYETYISKEVPTYIDGHYATRTDRASRAITGLSMGGHGALFIAFRHSASFGAAGSMSGGLDLTVMKYKYEIYKRLGDTTRYASAYKANSVLNVIEKKPEFPLSIIFDCGWSDAFYGMNSAVHQKMMKLKIAHDYIERPGGHDWNYWKNSLKYQLLYFNDFFLRR